MGQNLKIILLGESGVGKSSIVLRLKSGVFTHEKLPITFVDFHEKKIEINHIQVNLSIYDTGGEERFHSIVSSYYRCADGVLLVYDVTDVSTFHKVSNWLNELRLRNEEAEVIIAGNKNEDPSRKNVAVSTVKNFANTEKLEYMEISAKSGENVDMAFKRLAEKILITKGILSDASRSAKEQTVNCEQRRLDPAKDETIKLGQETRQSQPVKNTGGCCS